MLYCPNFFWNVLQVWMTGKDVYLQMTWSWPDKTWNILCSYCLQWNTSQSKFRNHYFLFLFAFSILTQLFLIWGCKFTVCHPVYYVHTCASCLSVLCLPNCGFIKRLFESIFAAFVRVSHRSVTEGPRKSVSLAFYFLFFKEIRCLESIYPRSRTQPDPEPTITPLCGARASAHQWQRVRARRNQRAIA